MKKGREDNVDKIEDEIKKLPEKKREAICWVILHLDLVKEMCRNQEMSNEKIEKYKEAARERGDYLMLALLCAVQTYNNSSKIPEQKN